MGDNEVCMAQVDPMLRQAVGDFIFNIPSTGLRTNCVKRTLGTQKPRSSTAQIPVYRRSIRRNDDRLGFVHAADWGQEYRRRLSNAAIAAGIANKAGESLVVLNGP